MSFYKELNELNELKKGKQGVGGLYVDFVPKSAWHSNLRTLFNKSDWDLIRKKVYKDAENCCSICGGFGDAHPVEAHERWSFNLKERTQTLLSVESLCPACHLSTHFGRAQLIGCEDEAFERFIYVNGWTAEDTRKHIEKAFDDYKNLSFCSDWTLDISWLNGYIELSDKGIQLIKRYSHQ